MDRQKSYNYASYNNQRYQYHDPHSNYNDNNYQDDYSQYIDDPDKLTDIQPNQDYISSKEASSIEEYNGQNNTYETSITDNQDYTYDNYSSYVDEDSQDTILQDDYFSGKDYLQNDSVIENFDSKKGEKRMRREYRENRDREQNDESRGEFIPPSGKTIDHKMANLHPELERNAQLEDQERISCMICHKVYSTKGNLKTHLRVVHNCSESKVDELLPNSTTKPDKNLPENMRMVCPLCKNHYRSRGNLRVHLKGTHELTLDEARKYLPQNPNRMSSSTKPKEYCPICHKTYTNKMNVRIHIKKIHAEFDYSTKEIKMLVDGELKPKVIYSNPIKKVKEKDRLMPGYNNTNSLNHSPSMSNSLSENNYSTDENIYYEDDSQQGIYTEMAQNDNADIVQYDSNYDGYNSGTLESNYPKKTVKRKTRADEYDIDSYQPQDQYQPYDMYSPNEDQTSLIIKSEYQDHYRPPSPYNSYDSSKTDPYSVNVQNNQTRPKNQIQVPARKMQKLEYSYEEETGGEYPQQASIPPPIPPRKPASMVNELYSDSKDQLYQEPNSTVNNNKSRKSMIDSCISLHNNFVSTCNKNLS